MALVTNPLNPKLMKQAVKPLALFTILIFAFSTLTAQLKIASITGSIAGDIRKVIHDYPNRFINIQGELVARHPQSTDYDCNFKVNGAESALVTVYSSKNNNVCSWQALMLTTEEFAVAKKKFKTLYTQLNNLSVSLENGSSFLLKAHYEEPVEEKKFTSIVFSGQTADEASKKLRVELVMVYEPMEWKVKVMVYDRDREDHERGQVEE